MIIWKKVCFFRSAIFAGRLFFKGFQHDKTDFHSHFFKAIKIEKFEMAIIFWKIFL